MKKVFAAIVACFIAVGVVSVLDAAINVNAFVEQLKNPQGETVYERTQYIQALREQWMQFSPEDQAAVTAALRASFARKAKNERIGGTEPVQYDTGVAHPFRYPAVGGVDGFFVGNDFNTGITGGVALPTHIVTAVTLQMGGTFIGTTVFLAPPAVGTTVPSPIASTGFSGVGANNLTTIGFASPVSVGTGSFLAVVNQSGVSVIPSTTFRHVALDINSGGFGFNAFAFDFFPNNYNPSPMVSTGGQFFAPFNFILRVRGQNLPVELMSFTGEVQE